MRVCNIYDRNFKRLGEIDTFVSYLWKEGYNTVGSFLLEVQKRSRTAGLLKAGHYVWCSGKRTVMYINSVTSYDTKTIATGAPAVWLLDQRVSNTTVKKNTNAEEAMRKLVTDMEPWDNVELGAAAGLPDVFPRQISDKSLLEFCEEISQEVDAGFLLRYDKKQKKLFFEVYKPEENRNLIFSESVGNITNVNISQSDIDYKNVAVVAGAGEGDKRVTVLAGDTQARGFDRREMYIDARSEQPEEKETDEHYRQRLVDYGLEKLAEQLKVENIKVDVPAADFGTRFWLGDIITCRIDELKIKLKVRITEYTETITPTQNKIQLSIGTPITVRRY